MTTLIAEKQHNARKPASSCAISSPRLKTVQDLLDTIRLHEPKQRHLLAMLSATAAHVSVQGTSRCIELDISRLLDVRFGLQAHLKERRFKKNSVRSYTNYLRIFVQKAAEDGWKINSDVSNACRKFSIVIAKQEGCAGVVRYAIRKGVGAT